LTLGSRLRVALIALILPWAVHACSPSDGPARGPADGTPPDGSRADGSGSVISLSDADGRQVQLPGSAARVLSLVPSATQTLAALGAASLVVARTDHDTVSWAQALPSVGGGLQPSLEAIVAARPDLVVRFAGPQDTRTPAALDELGIPHVGIRPDRIADALDAIRVLGAATGRAAVADSLVRHLQAGLDSVRADAAGRAPVRVAYVLGGDPPWVAGPGTYIHELLELAGGENAFADLGSLYAAVSVEEFLARDIDLILTPDAGRLGTRVTEGPRVVEVGDALEFPGPGVVEAARAVAAILRAGARR
jgi:iron complex transport system substrate-binding protein